MTNGWQTVPLRQVLNLDLTKVPLDAGTDYPMVGVYSFGRGLFLREPVSGNNTSYKFFYQLKAEHIVMSQLFGWEGALALSSEKFAGLFVSPQFPTFLCDESQLDREFLGWIMRRKSFWVDLGSRTKGMGDRRRTLNPEALLITEIPLPSLTEQRRIVAHIESLAARVNEAQRLREEAEIETKVISASARNLVFGELQKDLEPVRFDTIADMRLGKMLSEKSKTGLNSKPYLRNANIQWDSLDLSNVYEMDFDESEQETFRLKAGDILVCEGGDIGKSAIWNNEFEECYFQKALHRIRVDRDKTLPRYILYHIFWAAEQGHFADLKTQTTIPHLTGVKLKAYNIYLPPLDEQRRIVADLDGLQAKVNALRGLQSQTRAELDALIPSILDKAFKGEL